MKLKPDGIGWITLAYPDGARPPRIAVLLALLFGVLAWNAWNQFHRLTPSLVFNIWACGVNCGCYSRQDAERRRG